MAYKRGRGAGISRARRMKARRKEQAELQAQLNAIEVAKQNEARERQRSGLLGLAGGSLIQFLINPAAGIASYALAASLGKTAGDLSYRTGAFGMQRNEIEEAIEELENYDTTQMDLNQSAEENLGLSEMANEQLTGGDFTTDLVNTGTNFMQYYMALAALDKAAGAGKSLFGDTGSLGDFSDKIAEKFTS